MNYGENSNASYADDSFSVSGYDRYSNLSGINSCSSYSEYQMNATPYTPSACNFTDDYGPVADEYNVTPIPVMAALQYYPWNNVVQVNDGKIFAPKIVDVNGTVVVPKPGGINKQADQFNSLLGGYISGSFDDRIATLQARLQQLSQGPQTPQNAVNMKAIQDSINTLQASKMASSIAVAAAPAQNANASNALKELGKAAMSASAAPANQVSQAAQIVASAIQPASPVAPVAMQNLNALAQAAVSPQAANQQAVANTVATIAEGFKLPPVTRS